MDDPTAGGAAVALARRIRGWAVADLEVKLDPNDVARIQRLLAQVPRQVPQVISTALNKTATTARKEAAQKLSKITGLKVNYVRNLMALYKATRKYWQAKIWIKDWMIPATKFVRSLNSKGYTQFTKAGSNAAIEFKTLKGNDLSEETPFLATMPSTHQGLFQRKGIGRLPIQELYGPSLAEVFVGSTGVVEEVQRNAVKYLAKNVDGQVKRVLAKGA
jgi:hypothetical protein